MSTFPRRQSVRISPTEAVPVALVLNELMINAVKHGGRNTRMSRSRCAKARNPIKSTSPSPTQGNGLRRRYLPRGGQGLVSALMPRNGAALTRTQLAHWAVLRPGVFPPVIHLETAP